MKSEKIIVCPACGRLALPSPGEDDIVCQTCGKIISVGTPESEELGRDIDTERERALASYAMVGWTLLLTGAIALLTPLRDANKNLFANFPLLLFLLVMAFLTLVFLSNYRLPHKATAAVLSAVAFTGLALAALGSRYPGMGLLWVPFVSAGAAFTLKAFSATLTRRGVIDGNECRTDTMILYGAVATLILRSSSDSFLNQAIAVLGFFGVYHAASEINYLVWKGFDRRTIGCSAYYYFWSGGTLAVPVDLFIMASYLKRRIAGKRGPGAGRRG
ncbi:MAG: hypothetical protein LBO66_08660 [Deltaproteobacteria bacterium]|jgi:FtsH-binding integral membrane protein|nr:hypothetical protein [Deltaproteobacteria bacterium]